MGTKPTRHKNQSLSLRQGLFCGRIEADLFNRDYVSLSSRRHTNMKMSRLSRSPVHTVLLLALVVLPGKISLTHYL